MTSWYSILSPSLAAYLTNPDDPRNDAPDAAYCAAMDAIPWEDSDRCPACGDVGFMVRHDVPPVPHFRPLPPDGEQYPVVRGQDMRPARTYLAPCPECNPAGLVRAPAKGRPMKSYAIHIEYLVAGQDEPEVFDAVLEAASAVAAAQEALALIWEARPAGRGLLVKGSSVKEVEAQD